MNDCIYQNGTPRRRCVCSLLNDVSDWEGEYILCLRSYYILPYKLIKKASIAAINFHPAPPEYPGSGSFAWALFDESPHYGITAHFINKKIDNGQIIECRRFPILPEYNLMTLSSITQKKVYEMFVDFANGIVLEGIQFIDKKTNISIKEKWRGTARKIKEIDKLQHIDFDCDEKSLKKIIRATYTPSFPPYIILHGYKFLLEEQ